MKMFSGTARFVGCQSTQWEGACLALVLGAVIFATGCGKKENAAPATTTVPTPAPTPQDTTQPTTENTTPVPNQPGPPRADPAAAAKLDVSVPVLVQLNRAILRYRMQSNHNPGSVEEASAVTGIQLPPPPSGKKYILNRKGFVVLTDNSAK